MAVFKTYKFFTNLSTIQKSDSVEIRNDSSVRNWENSFENGNASNKFFVGFQLLAGSFRERYQKLTKSLSKHHIPIFCFLSNYHFLEGIGKVVVGSFNVNNFFPDFGKETITDVEKVQFLNCC